MLSSVNRIFKTRSIHVFLILLLGFLAYSNTFHVPGHFDDTINIFNNPMVKDLSYYFNPSKAEELKGTFHYNSFKQRYIGFLSFALNYRFHGLNVTGYHIVNLFVHIINALLVYVFIALTFRTPFMQGSSLKEHERHIAFFGAVLFVCHPIQTQAVTYIVQRLASLATLFYLLSMVMYIKMRLVLRGSGTVYSEKIKPLLYYLASLASAALAMKTKQTAFTLPIMIALYELMFFDGKTMKRARYLTPMFLTMLIIPLSLMGLDRPMAELIGDVNENVLFAKGLTWQEYLFTEFRVLVTYIRLVFLPIGQNLDYDYPKYRTFFNTEVLASFLFLVSLFGLAVFLFYRSRISERGLRIVSFSIFWFFVALSVESSFIPIVDVIFEHRMYLASTGVFFAISSGVFFGVEKLKGMWQGLSPAVIGLLTLAVIALTGATYARNTVWNSEVSLWKDVVSKSPDNARGHNNLGKSYKSLGLIDKAIDQYKIAVELNPAYPVAHYNLGVAYESKGLIDKAIEHYQSAIKVNPKFLMAHNNLGVAYREKGFLDEAVKHYMIVIKLTPNYPDAHSNLGVAYYEKGLLDKAINHFKTAIKIDPLHADAHYNLGIAYGAKGQYEKARREMKIGIDLGKH